MICDNKRETHAPHILHDDASAMVAGCAICKTVQVFRKDPSGRMDNRAYLKFFKRELLQPNSNLYYKYHADELNIGA